MKAISFSSPNGNVLVLVLSDAGKLTSFICEPVNRTKLLEWLLFNQIDQKASKGILEFVESETQAARSAVGQQVKEAVSNATKKVTRKIPEGK